MMPGNQRRITRVEQLVDGYVEVFDEDGDHLTEYEGDAKVAVPKILKAGWREGFVVVNRRRKPWPRPRPR